MGRNKKKTGFPTFSHGPETHKKCVISYFPWWSNGCICYEIRFPLCNLLLLISRKRIPVLSVSSSVVSANDIRGLSPQARNCYFSDEGSLLYYKSYTFSNCMFECSIKAAQALLKCSLWFLPHPSGMVICDPWSGFRFSAILESGGGECGHCLPDCESVTLDITQNRPESTQSDLRSESLKD